MITATSEEKAALAHSFEIYKEQVDIQPTTSAAPVQENLMSYLENTQNDSMENSTDDDDTMEPQQDNPDHPESSSIQDNKEEDLNIPEETVD